MEDSTATPVPPLGESLGQLKAIMTRYRGAKAHWVSDLILYNFAMDVREQSEAILALSGAVGRRATYANARAALESARDLAFLTTDEGQYDSRAARARAFEVFENAELERRAPSVPESSGPPPASPPPEDILIQDADDWEDAGPGMGTVMRRAIEDVQRDKDLLRRHWSGLKHAELYEAITVHWGGDPKMLEALEALLAMSAHPRPRTGRRTLELQGDTFLLGDADGDNEVPPSIASLACLMAVEAIKRRATFFQVEGSK
jgi:hypothetical protein